MELSGVRERLESIFRRIFGDPEPERPTRLRPGCQPFLKGASDHAAAERRYDAWARRQQSAPMRRNARDGDGPRVRAAPGVRMTRQYGYFSDLGDRYLMLLGGVQYGIPPGNLIEFREEFSDDVWWVSESDDRKARARAFFKKLQRRKR